MALMIHVHAYIKTLQDVRLNKQLTEAGEINLNDAIQTLNIIYNQQSDELKVIE